MADEEKKGFSKEELDEDKPVKSDKDDKKWTLHEYTKEVTLEALRQYNDPLRKTKRPKKIKAKAKLDFEELERLREERRAEKVKKERKKKILFEGEIEDEEKTISEWEKEEAARKEKAIIEGEKEEEMRKEKAIVDEEKEEDLFAIATSPFLVSQIDTEPSGIDMSKIDDLISTVQKKKLHPKLKFQSDDIKLDVTMDNIYTLSTSFAPSKSEPSEIDQIFEPEDDRMTWKAKASLSGALKGEVKKELEEEAAEEKELTVLDPDHPLMARFQNALKVQLEKQLEKFSMKLKDMLEKSKNFKKERTTIGTELYAAQQELDYFMDVLDTINEEVNQKIRKRKRAEAKLATYTNRHKKVTDTANQEKKTEMDLKVQYDKITHKVIASTCSKDEAMSDLKVVRLITQKIDVDVNKAEVDKQKQDMLINKLVETLQRLKEQITTFDMQKVKQTENKREAQVNLSELYLETESLGVEKKQILFQVDKALKALRWRDEAFIALQEQLSNIQRSMMILDQEMDACKRAISREHSLNEKFTLKTNTLLADLTLINKNMEQCAENEENLKILFSDNTRILEETEHSLRKILMEKSSFESEVQVLQKQISKEYQEKASLEDQILEKMHSQLTMEKAAMYTDKIIKKLREKTKHMEQVMVNMENEMSKSVLECAKTAAKNLHLKQIFDQASEDIKIRENTIARRQVAIKKGHLLIEKKQGQINGANKRYEKLLKGTGSKEISSLDLEISNLLKLIDTKINQCSEIQKIWLRQQVDLVHLSNERETELENVESLKKNNIILLQAKLRVDRKIKEEREEIRVLETDINGLQNDLRKLSYAVNKEKGTKNELQQDTDLIEHDILLALKEEELTIIKMQNKLEGIKEEREQFVNSLTETEHQILLWQKKIALTKEAKDTITSHAAQEEMQMMRTEIHRMQLRYNHIKKQQEQLMQEMEKSISSENYGFHLTEDATKENKNVVLKSSLERQVTEANKKIKQAEKEGLQLDDEIKDLSTGLATWNGQVEEKLVNCHQLQGTQDSLYQEIEKLNALKQKNLEDLVSKQQKNKYLQAVIDDKYVLLCKSEETLETETTKQKERLSSLQQIIEKIDKEFSRNLSTDLLPIKLKLTTRVQSL